MGREVRKIKKRVKIDCERNRTLFPVIKAHGVRLPQIESPVWKIEPERPRFDNFLEAQTGMEAAEKDKSQFVSGCFSNQPVAKIEAAEIFPCAANRSRQFHVLYRIATGDSSGLDGPAEERTDRHDVAEGRRVGGAFERFVIETLNLPCCNGAGGGPAAGSWQTREVCCVW